MTKSKSIRYNGGHTLWPNWPNEKIPSLLLPRKKKGVRAAIVAAKIKSGSPFNGLSANEVENLLREPGLLLASGVEGPHKYEFAKYAQSSFRRLQVSLIITDQEVATTWNAIGKQNNVGEDWTELQVAVLRRRIKALLKEQKQRPT